MPVAIKGTNGGSVILDAGAAAANSTLTLPNTSGTILQSGTAVTAAQGGTGVTSTGSAGNVLFTADGSTWSATQKIVAGTAQASTSGTSIDFTSIPSWVKRVTVMFNGVSTNGSDRVIVQLGTSGGVVASGYLGSATYVGGSISAVSLNNSTGLSIDAFTGASNTRYGNAIITNVSGNTWCMSSVIGISDAAANGTGGGTIALSGTLTTIRITTSGGTNTFDAGSINIMYE